MSKLLLKCKSLLSKKKHYKHELTNLTKKFENLKNEFSSLVKSNDKLVNDLKNSNSLEEQLKKANDENHKLSNEMLELRNSISKFQKGKATLDNLLESQKSHGDTQGIGYGLHHDHILILLNPYHILHLLPLNKMSLKLLKLR